MENQLDQPIYKSKIKLNKIFYPKGATKVSSGEFAIFVAEKVDTDDDTKYIKLKGTVCYLDNKSEYNVTYRLKEQNQYGKTYEIIHIYRNIDDNTVDGQKEFFKIFISEKIIEELYKTYKTSEEIKNILINRDIDKLMAIKGIGEHKANKIIDEFNNQKKYELLYTELAYLNLSPLLIKKLLDYYGDTQTVIKTINDDVYSLIKVKGIGFKKADEIASKNGISPTDYRRIKAFILYYLEEQAEIGKCYISFIELYNAMYDNLGEISKVELDKSIQKLEDYKQVIIIGDKKFIALEKMYTLELNIFYQFQRLNIKNKKVTIEDLKRVENAIKISEEKQGFSFTDEQKQAIKDSVYHNVIAITGGAGCVDCDTQYLSKDGWKKISEYRLGEKVLQYNHDGTAEFVEPLRYIKQPQETLWYVHNSTIDMCLSENHNCVYINNNRLIVKPFNEIANIHHQSGFDGKLITGFNNNNQGLNISDELLQLYTIMLLGGEYQSNDKHLLCSIRIEKLKSYKRYILIKALEKLGIEFVERNQSDSSRDISFYTHERFENFPKEWYLLNKHQFEVIIDIIRNYSNTLDEIKDNTPFTSQWFYNVKIADFIQFAIASTGHRGEIIKEPIENNHCENSTEKYRYCVSWHKHILVDFNHDAKKVCFDEYPTKDGFEYCFTVPSNMLILRRKNKIFVTGNCGKTTTANGIFNVFDKNKILACALSGKASVRISEATGLQANTIHKTLGFTDHGFTYNEYNQLSCDCFLIDESTMVNGSLFLNVLKAIPTGATLIMCGDIKQLTPIGNCQVFYDILKYSDVQVIELTKPHRQALKSGIITTSLNVSKQRQILSPYDRGKKVFGELQDMIIKIQESRTTIFDEIINTFKEEYEKTHHNIFETQIIVAVRNRGDVSTYNINQEIQKIVNPNKDTVNKIEILSHTIGGDKYYYNIQVGDKVINKKNNYHCYNSDGKEIPVFNGNIGIIKEITDIDCVIDFNGIGEVIFEKDNWENLELAYALTCHKTQGSGFDNVIIGLDNNSYLMNHSEWLYTALTRAKKRCTLISTNNTIYYTITQKETIKKQTFLGLFYQGNLQQMF